MRNNEEIYREADISKVEKNEININISIDYLQIFNDRIKDNDFSGIFHVVFRVKSDIKGNYLFSLLSLAISGGEINPK